MVSLSSLKTRLIASGRGGEGFSLEDVQGRRCWRYEEGNAWAS